MSSFRTRRIGSIAAGLLVLLVLFSVLSCRKHGGGSANARAMQDFRLETLDRGRFYLNEQREKVVVLVFWATWCTACKTAMAELAPVFASFPAGTIAAAAVCTDPENRSEVEAVRDGLELSYPVLLDRDAELFLKLGLQALPTTIVIDQDGVVQYQKAGYSPAIKKQIELRLSGLLG